MTGIVCGILGCMIKNESSDGGGKFRVKKVFMPDYPSQIPRQKLTTDSQIAFISGMNSWIIEVCFQSLFNPVLLHGQT